METKADLRRALADALAKIEHLERVIDVLNDTLDRVQVTQAARGLETR